MNNNCEGITKKNVKCSNLVKNGKYCHHHIKQSIKIAKDTENFKDISIPKNKSPKITKSTDENKIFIGNGTYGKIYKITDEKINEIKIIKELNLQTNGTITEIMFFNKYCKDSTSTSTTFFPKLFNILINNDIVNITMSYAGITLLEYSSTMNYEKRLTKLISLLIQVGNILSWFKRNKLIHMDISSKNICIENDIIKIIDFGFVFNKMYVNRYHVGTYNYADPSYYVSKIHDYSYDIFSSGLVFFEFLNKSNVNPSVIKKMYEQNDNDMLLHELNYTHHINSATDINKCAVECLSKMIIFNNKKRLICEGLTYENIVNKNFITNTQEYYIKEYIEYSVANNEHCSY